MSSAITSRSPAPGPRSLVAVPPARRRDEVGASGSAAAATATVNEVVTEAAVTVVDQVAQWNLDGEPVRYVPPPLGSNCGRALECLPLAGLLDTDPALTGHLHRRLQANGPPARRHPSQWSEPRGVADAGRSDADTVGPMVHALDPDRVPRVPLVAVGRMIAAEVHRDLLDVELAHARHQVLNLQVALESNRSIGVAIGIVMAAQRCTAEQAFQVLRTASQNQNRKLREIAAEVQYTGAAPARTPARSPATDTSRCD